MGGREQGDGGPASTVDRDLEVVVFRDADGTLVEVEAVEPESGDARLEPPDTSSAAEEPLTWPPGDPRWLLVPGDT